MDFLLYKQAVMEKKIQHQVAGAVGGGALGYLLTRYGLGIKGVGAGLTGAGLGAAAGAGVGGYLSDYGNEAVGKGKQDKQVLQKLKGQTQETWGQTVRRNARKPYVWGGALGVGGWRAAHADKAIADNLEDRATRVASDMLSAQGKKGASQLGKKYLGKLDEPLSRAIRNQINVQGSGSAINRATKALNQAIGATKGVKGGTKYGSKYIREILARIKRGGGTAAVVALGLTAALTAVDKQVSDPRRRDRLAMEGM